jgi:flagellar basal-body rod modification protein FlgD
MANATTGSSSAVSSSDASSSSSTISANDFLTLLVTEMQNQDPTANTDPNEYINQLVQVNSLEQLIDINQNLSTALGDTSSSGASGGVAGAVPGTTPTATSSSPASLAAQAGVSAQGAQHKGTGVTAVTQNAVPTHGTSGATLAANHLSTPGAKHAPGNLSVPDSHPAAQRVAHSLNGKSHSRSINGRLPGTR